MIHEISIYGDIVPFKSEGTDTEYCMNDLSESLSKIKFIEGDELLINIHSMGGDTATAFSIFHKLQNLKQRNSIQITTRVDGWCASSGVIILLAGDKRIGNAYAEPFVHNAWVFAGGIDSEDAQKIMDNLERVNSQIAKLYAERTNINYDLARQLMNADDFISPEKALEYGFYTELENIPNVESHFVFNAMREKNKQKFKNNMSKDKESAWNKLKKQVSDFFNDGLQNKILYTADNSELDFYELSEDDTPNVGDKAKFDGKPAGDSNDGKYVMASGETYIFSGEELTEIIPKEDEDLKAENEALKTEIENLKTENKKVNKKLSDATSIINNFKKLNDDDDDDERRDPKPTPEKGSRVSNAIKNLNKK